MALRKLLTVRGVVPITKSWADAHKAILVPCVPPEKVRNLTVGVPHPVDLRFPDGTTELSLAWFSTPDGHDVEVTLERGVLAGTEVWVDEAEG
jgi:hypothetical protein